jgi:hypothetical protein
VVLTGFVDDSGSGEGIDRGNIFVLAGFVSTPERWKDFSDRWKIICDQEPKTPDFHIANDIRLKNRDGSVRWTKDQRDTRIRELVDLIKTHAKFRVDSVLAWPNYDRVVKGRIPPALDNPYFLCFCNVLISVAEYMDKAGIDGTVDWTFDEQGRVGSQANKWYEFIRANMRPQLQRMFGRKPVFGHDKNLLPLKAADIYAWQIRRHLDREQPQGIPPNDYIETLLDLHGASNNIKGEHLGEFVANVGHGLMLKADCGFYLPLRTDQVKPPPIPDAK